MTNIRYYTTLFSCYLVLTGLLYSRVMMSIGMGLIFLSAIIHPEIFGNVKSFFTQKIWWIVSLLFFIYLLSGVYTENHTAYFERLKIRTPFLLLPVAFASLPAIKRNDYLNLFYFFLLLITVSAVISTIRYYKNFDEINILYFQSKVLPTPIHHIRYSLMVVFAIATGFYLIINSYYIYSRFEKIIFILITAFLIFYLHILSSRISLLVFYLLAISGAIYYFVKLKKWLLLSIALVLLLVTPFFSYHFLDSFKHRVWNTQMDIKIASEGGNANYWSIGKRFVAWTIAWKIFKSNPVWGVGVGDLKDEMITYYQRDYKEFQDWSWILPHNQFLHYLASFGILGFLVYAGSLFYPLFYQRNWTDYFFLIHFLIFFVSLFTESTLEDQRGTCFYILFTCLNLNQLVSQKCRT